MYNKETEKKALYDGLLAYTKRKNSGLFKNCPPDVKLPSGIRDLPYIIKNAKPIPDDAPRGIPRLYKVKNGHGAKKAYYTWSVKTNTIEMVISKDNCSKVHTLVQYLTSLPPTVLGTKRIPGIPFINPTDQIHVRNNLPTILDNLSIAERFANLDLPRDSDGLYCLESLLEDSNLNPTSPECSIPEDDAATIVIEDFDIGCVMSDDWWHSVSKEKKRNAFALAAGYTNNRLSHHKGKPGAFSFRVIRLSLKRDDGKTLPLSPSFLFQRSNDERGFIFSLRLDEVHQMGRILLGIPILIQLPYNISLLEDHKPVTKREFCARLQLLVGASNEHSRNNFNNPAISAADLKAAFLKIFYEGMEDIPDVLLTSETTPQRFRHLYRTSSGWLLKIHSESDPKSFVF